MALAAGSLHYILRPADDKELPAQIIKSRTLEARPGEPQLHYYVHYLKSDRRLDEWVASDRVLRPLGREYPQHLVPDVSLPPSSKRARSEYDAAEHPQQHRQEQQQGASARAGTTSTSLFHHGAGHDEHSKVRNIHSIQFGKHEIDAWYYSPYPEPFGSAHKLYICEHTFNYFLNAKAYLAHVDSLPVGSTTRLPGREIYREDATSGAGRCISVYEVDGRQERLFCQNLCLFGKLFIEHKTLYFDPEPFFFYVLVERDAVDGTCHPVGYFSKERESSEGYNLACILTLPPFQRKGYGRFIISLSYEISRREGKCGSPEKPLSDLGKISYRSYWACTLLERLAAGELSIQALAEDTGIRAEDIVSTLQKLGFVRQFRGSFVLSVDKDVVQHLRAPFAAKRYSEDFCRPELLKM